MSSISAKKTLPCFLILVSILLSISLASFAQTEEQITAEADAVLKKFTDQMLAAGLKNTDNVTDLLKVDPFNAKAYYWLTDSYRTSVPSESERVKIVSTYQTYFRIAPNDTWGYWNFALFLKNQGRVGEADKYFAKSEEFADQLSFEDQYIRGEAAFMNGNYQQCVKSMEKAVTLKPNQGDQRWAYSYLSMCQRYLGDKQNAELNQQKAISIGGDDVKNNLELRNAEAVSEPSKCGDKDKMLDDYIKKDYSQNKDLDKKYVHYIKIRNCFPRDSRVAGFGSLFAYENPFLKHWYATYKALETPRNTPYDQVTEDEKLNVLESHSKATKNYLAQREDDKAWTESVSLLLYLPTNYAVRNMRVRFFLKTAGLKILAWREANNALKNNPQSDIARLIRARVYYELKNNKDKALAELAEAIKIDPNNAELYFERGKIYNNEKEYAKAVSDFDTTLKIKPKYPEAAYYQSLAQNPQNASAIIAAREKRLQIVAKYEEVTGWAQRAMDDYLVFKRNSGGKSLSAKCEKARFFEGRLNLYLSEYKKIEGMITPDDKLYQSLKSSQTNVQEIANAHQKSMKDCPK